ncbi:MAG: hypothetical protein HBSIN02_25600 [Bacteroidia bacterium]|nr:MAG: hypothetical protein HBSIN02_25600 [Bacteroidia bacterium]
MKVVLAGQGADEPLAGYQRYIGENMLTKFFPVLRFIPLKSIARLLRRSERFKRATYASQFRDELKRFLAIYSIFTPLQKDQLLLESTKCRIDDANTELIKRLYDETNCLADPLAKLLYIDTRMSLSDDLLLFGDKMSMAHSLEMRVPFLDLELVRFLEGLPSSMKLRRLTGKYIHKRAAMRWLPRYIIKRKKRGFATPMDNWLRRDLAEVTKRLIGAEDSACQYYFNLEYIRWLIEMHQRGRENFQRHIFALLSFELWHREFF